VPVLLLAVTPIQNLPPSHIRPVVIFQPFADHPFQIHFTYGLEDLPQPINSSDFCNPLPIHNLIQNGPTLLQWERARLLDPLLRQSADDAIKRGESLALIRPQKTRFIWRPKKADEIEEEREAYRLAARQTSMLDQDLAELDPTPYEFRFRFEDGAGCHDYENGDAMFWHACHRSGANEALRWVDRVFNEDYPRRGMAFAIGNQVKPRTRSRTAASIGSNQSSKRYTAVSATDCEESGLVVMLFMAWSPIRRSNVG
jgi:hypothetical protein